jgi:hypothetical protein
MNIPIYVTLCTNVTGFWKIHFLKWYQAISQLKTYPSFGPTMLLFWPLFKIVISSVVYSTFSPYNHKVFFYNSFMYKVLGRKKTVFYP